MKDTNVKTKRGCVYKFLDKNGNDTDKYVLVISDDYRCSDNLISILMLGDVNKGRDAVEISGKKLGSKYVHCEIVTYCNHTQIGDFVMKLSSNHMNKIDSIILKGLGLNNKTLEDLDFYKAQYKFYKNEYNKLIDKITSNK